MVYTVTFNPAVDYILNTDGVNFGGLSRCASAEYFFSGKGINVATVLHRLGIKSEAVTFLGGFTGAELKRRLEKDVKLDVIDIPGELTRINVKLRASDKTESELNAPGARIGERELSRLFGKLDRMTAGDTLVLAGSIPPGLEKSVYGDIFSAYRGKGIRFCADCAGELLRGTLDYRPFVVKPNTAELEETLCCRVKSISDAVGCADELRSMGAQNVLVTMGSAGALLCASDGSVRRAIVPAGGVVSTIGAGDSTLAGFIAGYDLYASRGAFPNGNGAKVSDLNADGSDNGTGITSADNGGADGITNISGADNGGADGIMIADKSVGNCADGARLEYALRLAAACGTATARCAALAQRDGIEEIFGGVKVERIR